MAEFKPDINQARRVLGLSDDAFLVAQTPQQKYGVWVPEHRHHIHIPFTFYRQNDENDPGKWLYFWVNPSECAWTMATRTSIEKISGGAVHHEWPSTGVGEQGSSRFDQPVVRFSFQSGVVTPYAYQDVSNGDAKGLIPPGIGNFYDFMSLMDQSNVTSAGTPNYVNVIYFSSTFPRLQLKGHFTPEGVNWTDSANDPYTISNWGASLEVFASTPRLNSSELRNTFKEFGFRF